MGQYKATCFLVPGISHNINFSANPFSVPAIITHETRVWPTDTCKCNTPKPVPVQRGNGARRVSLQTCPFVPVISVFKDWNLRFAMGYNKHYNPLRPKRLRLNHTQRRNTRPKPLGDSHFPHSFLNWQFFLSCSGVYYKEPISLSGGNINFCTVCTSFTVLIPSEAQALKFKERLQRYSHTMRNSTRWFVFNQALWHC